MCSVLPLNFKFPLREEPGLAFLASSGWLVILGSQPYVALQSPPVSSYGILFSYLCISSLLSHIGLGPTLKTASFFLKDLFLAALGLCCCLQDFSSCIYSVDKMHKLLIAVVSLVVENRL